MNQFTKRVLQLKKNKKDIINQEKNGIGDDLQLKLQKNQIDNEINQNKKLDIIEKQKEKDTQNQLKTELMKECRYETIKICKTIQKLFPRTFRTKWSLSELCNRSQSYFLVLESSQNQGVSYQTIQDLRDNISMIKSEIQLFLEDDDENYKDCVKRVLNSLIEKCDDLERKILKLYYGIKL